MLSPLRTRLNEARNLQPTFINPTTYKVPAYSTDDTYTVTVNSSRVVTNGIAHSSYRTNCQCKGHLKACCKHSLATVRSIARLAGKRITFYATLDNALIGRRAKGGALVEVTNGSKKVYGVVYR